MAEFLEYLHVERYGNDEVDGIELGETHVFPKLDGTNSSCWWDDSNMVGCGSRHRELTLVNDNQGFMEYIWKDERFTEFFKANPNLRLFGEWLVPHSLKTYREDVWRRFWVFDVYNNTSNQFLRYADYQSILEKHQIDYIPPIAIIKNGSPENFARILEANIFFIQDGKGVGEGIVLKNYDFLNKYNQLAYAKIVTSEFKEKHSRAMGPPEVGGSLVEEHIALEFITEALCQKNHAKITNERGGWKSEYIPELLGRVWHDLITEEMWNILKNKKYMGPINFKTLRNFTNRQVKTYLPDVF